MRIVLADYFKLHGRPEMTALVDNAEALLAKVNKLLAYAEDAGIVPGIDQISHNHVSSGYRPAGVNAATRNAALRSKHLTCHAVDLQDTIHTRALATWCVRHLARLEECGLWMEDPRWTGGRINTDPWVHLQDVPPGSGRRIYIPVDPRTSPPTDPTFFLRARTALP